MTENKSDPRAPHAPDTSKQHQAGTFLAKQGDDPQNTADADDNRNNLAQQPNPLEAVIRAWDFIKKPEHANAIMATFTIFIFLATGAYAVIATLQWCEMTKATDIANKSLIADTRAWISPTSVMTNSAGFRVFTGI